MNFHAHFKYHRVFTLFCVTGVLFSNASQNIPTNDVEVSGGKIEALGEEKITDVTEAFRKIVDIAMKEKTEDMDEMKNALRSQGKIIKEMKQEIKILHNKVSELEMTVEKIGNQSTEERLEHLEEMEKVTSLRSCYELEQYGVIKSGTYHIDPDGPLTGSHPFSVECDFQKSVTEVLHDVEYPVEVEHCSGDFCFLMPIDYGVSMSQLEALIDNSETCTQQLTYNCFLAPLATLNEEPVGVWVNRHGTDEEYFSGSNSGVHICECGLHSNCSDSAHGYKCNCDSEIPITQQDDGLLTDMSSLPVTAFKYGNLEYETEWAAIEVGRLKCQGKKEIKQEEIYNSCQNLKLHGESASGNYVMNSGKVSFCDFEKEINDPEIEKEVQPWMRFNDVLFIAVREHPDSAHIPEGIVSFDRLVVDVYGNTFEPTTGTFTVPKTGVYLFVLDGLLGNGNATKYFKFFALKVNGANVKQLYDGGYGEYHQVSGVFAAKLDSGDSVTLSAETSIPFIQVHPVHPLTFMGMLIL